MELLQEKCWQYDGSNEHVLKEFLYLKSCIRAGSLLTVVNEELLEGQKRPLFLWSGDNGAGFKERTVSPSTNPRGAKSSQNKADKHKQEVQKGPESWARVEANNARWKPKTKHLVRWLESGGSWADYRWNSGGWNWTRWGEENTAETQTSNNTKWKLNNWEASWNINS